MNYLLSIMAMVGEGRDLPIVSRIVPSADELAAQRLEMVPILEASHNR
jgi:hypothetical protein